jgi:hypothetical protein
VHEFYLSTLSTSRTKRVDVGGWATRVSASILVERTERSLTVLLRILEAADTNRESDNAISRESMSVPLPAGSRAGGRGAALTMGGTEDAPSIFAGNLDITRIRCLNLPRRFDRDH